MYSYQYFQDPAKWAYRLAGNHRCDICHSLTECFDARTFAGTQSYQAFCFKCVADGRLEDIDCSAVDPDLRSLKQQLSEFRPRLSPEEKEHKIKHALKILLYTTPAFPTWQDFLWPAHCGDFCQFIRLAGQLDFNTLSTDGDGKQLFRATLEKDLQLTTDVEAVWKALKEGSVQGIVSPEDNWSPMAYVFLCKHCNQYVTLWDCD